METVFEIAAAFRSGVEACDSPSKTASPEHILIRQLQAGDEMAYRGFVERYQTRIFRVAHGILGNQGEAEEIAQRVFVKVFVSIASFGGRSSLFTWVHRIAVNECYAVLRKRGFMVSLDTQNADSPVSARWRTLPDPSPCSETVVLQRDYLNRLLESIPNKDRQLLLLREVEGLSTAELAEAAGLNENTVKLRLFRTRQRLAKAAEQMQRSRKTRLAARECDQVGDLQHGQRP